MRRVFISLIFLILLAGVGMAVYGYVADLPPPTETVEKPAAGVGFSE